MSQKSIVVTAACLEIVAGAAFIVVLDLPCYLLFAVRPEGIGIILGRFAGVGLFALGLACLSSTMTRSQTSAARGLFVFNLATAVLFTWVGIIATQRGILLWPAAVLHACIAAALLPQVLTFRIQSAIGEEPATKALH